MELRPYQERAIAEARKAAQHHKSIVITLPTGAGKTVMMTAMADQDREQFKKVAIFTNRKWLTMQSSRSLAGAEVSHGVMAAGHAPALLRDVQVCSIQTIGARVFGSGRWELPQADVVHVDEAHSNTAETATKIIDHYKEAGAVVYGWTATPTYLANHYDHLVIGANKRELRACGALVECQTYAPSEPDMKGVTKNAIGEFTQDGMRKRVMQTVVFADVFQWWRKLNPSEHQTILFAPGVDESRWFCDEFQKLGIPAEHVDADTPDDRRQEILEGSKAGDISVICNYGVLREGVDLPWVRCGILVQPCGAISTYLQIVGRLLRPWPGKTHATLIDMAGCWHRHGSPNDDHDWSLLSKDTEIAKERKKALERGEKEEGICCPECGKVRRGGPVCPVCGHQHVRSVRKVRMLNGELKKMTGSVTKAKTQDQIFTQKWNSCLFAAARSKRTVRQAMGMFHSKMGVELPEHIHPQPEKNSIDWNRRVGEVYSWTMRTPARKA